MDQKGYAIAGNYSVGDAIEPQVGEGIGEKVAQISDDRGF